MAILAQRGGPDTVLSGDDQQAILETALQQLPVPRRVLLVPPDITRLNSGAGNLTARLYERLSPDADVDVLPAIGTHEPMTETEIRAMFGSTIPLPRFRVHDWRHGIEQLGEIEGHRLRDWSEGALDYSIRVEISRLLLDGYDLIMSLGQVVPHEVVGMANYSKNILIGTGGSDIINKSHFLGAVYGMERMMGRIDTPVRRLLDFGMEQYLGQLPLCFALTVMARDTDSGAMAMRGLFVGSGQDTFRAAARLSQQVNLDLLDAPLRKVVVYLDPREFKSTWLGNKAVYRTRMAIADQGELIVLAPGLRGFGEDPDIDRLVRTHGYRGTPATLEAVQRCPELANNLSAAAHLIHGSSEGRFTITYCPGPGLDPGAIRSAGFEAAPLEEMLQRYPLDRLRDGMNVLPNGEEVFFISNPALGLWALRQQFTDDAVAKS